VFGDTNPTKYVSLISIDPYGEVEFTRVLKATLGNTDSRDVLVFVHGYLNTFADAAYRTAQMAYDLNFPGVAFCYSWPSLGKTWKYMVDETNSKWTVPHLQKVIQFLRTEVGARVVHVIAHSMGNRVLVETLQTLATAQPATAAKLREIVLAAPDIDAGTFRQVVDQFRGHAERCTLYGSSKDRALFWSRKFHQYPRAGDTGRGLVVVDGIDTIDASAVDTSLLTNGHGYYGNNRSILGDIFMLLTQGLPPDQRFGLRVMALAGKRYWFHQP
jgi:esterase/lipase superfamily enzyme